LNKQSNIISSAEVQNLLCDLWADLGSFCIQILDAEQAEKIPESA
jgi:hypothetical protein